MMSEELAKARMLETQEESVLRAESERAVALHGASRGSEAMYKTYRANVVGPDAPGQGYTPRPDAYQVAKDRTIGQVLDSELNALQGRVEQVQLLRARFASVLDQPHTSLYALLGSRV